MKKSFRTRIINEGIVDTQRYRYCYREFATWACIKRLPIEMVGTTAELSDDNWEELERIGY